jgi:hypothetical protein
MGRGQDFNPDHGEGGRISIQIMGEGQHLKILDQGIPIYHPSKSQVHFSMASKGG